MLYRRQLRTALLPCAAPARPLVCFALCAASVVVSTGASLPVEAATPVALEKIVVTATREEKPQNEVAESVGVLDKEDIELVSPAHPAELLNRSAGVHINNLGGEGHMTAIRQPLSTSGVYLFLEDGIPTRPTGLFNHNALYEINVPHADRVEIIKGPGSALYGSDSIGGIVNVLTQPSPDAPTLTLNPEIGRFGWKRLLASGGAPLNDALGFRLDFHATDNEGHRDAADYKRYATTARFDGFIGDDTSYKTILSYSDIDQSGVSSLEAFDYENNRTKNFFHNEVGRREVSALRLSTAFSYEPDANNLYTLTPFYRNNEMKLMPSWMLSYDPNDRDYQFQSYGVLAKFRRKLPEQKAEFIAGVDVDYTPSTYREVRLSTVRDAAGIYTNTLETGRVNYDYDADQLSISPYLHTEWQRSKKLRLTGGLRYDYFDVDYKDNLPSSVIERQSGFGGFSHFRPDNQSLSWDHLSPKLGAIYQLKPRQAIYANYRHSFRVPSIGQLFRSGASTNTASLKPVQTNSVEFGTRGAWADAVQYDLAVYHMRVKDDIVRYIDSSANDRRITNAGETHHEGVEVSVDATLHAQWQVQVAWTVTNQKYEDYSAVFGFPATQINYAGNTVGKSPKTLGNLALQYYPGTKRDTTLELEWVHVGDYFTDETNTQKYGGHDLVNLRCRQQVIEGFEVYARVTNVFDKLYSTYTSNQVGDADIQYRPGLPRAYFVGLKSTF